MAIPLVKNGISLDSSNLEKLAKGIVIGACKQLKECQFLQCIIFVDGNDNSRHYLLEKLVELWKNPPHELPNLAWDCYQEGDKFFDILLFRTIQGKNDNASVGAKVGDILDKNLHQVNSIVNDSGLLEEI